VASTRERIWSVAGPVAPEVLGMTLPHEHLIVEGWPHDERTYLNSASMELEKYVAAGGRTIVDLSPIGRARDPQFVRGLAARTGVQVILGTGYAHEGWLPDAVRDETAAQLAETLIGELTTGIGDTPIRAGVIGEIAISPSFTVFEHRCVEAAAIAQGTTGAPVVLVMDLGATLAEVEAVLRMFEGAGGDPGRLAVGHVPCAPRSIDVCDAIADHGAWVLFDCFGQERGSLSGDLLALHPEVQVSSIKGFLDRGLGDRMLLSQDVNHVELLTVNGGDGYSLLGRGVARRAHDYGVTPDDWTSLVVLNPRRFLTGERPGSSQGEWS
jgi:phosphotriesterase-related protein